MNHYIITKRDNAFLRAEQVILARNEKIRSWYAKTSPATGRRMYSVRKLAAIFHLSPTRIWEIINPKEKKS